LKALAYYQNRLKVFFGLKSLNFHSCLSYVCMFWCFWPKLIPLKITLLEFGTVNRLFSNFRSWEIRKPWRFGSFMASNLLVLGSYYFEICCTSFFTDFSSKMKNIDLPLIDSTRKIIRLWIFFSKRRILAGFIVKLHKIR